MDTTNWEQVLDGLRVPFSVEVVAWKPQTISRERKRCLAVPYVDTQPYQERLDQVCPEWQDDYAIWFSDPQEALGRGGEKRVISGKVFVKCRLTIAERTRSDVGECELTDDNALTSAKAQAFKRACAAFGLGRYLYDLPKPWVDFDADRGIPEVELKKLENLLRRLGVTAAVEGRTAGAAPPVRPEANGQALFARAGTNGHSRPPAAGGARPALAGGSGDLRRSPSHSGATPGPAAGQAPSAAAPGSHRDEDGAAHSAGRAGEAVQSRQASEGAGRPPAEAQPDAGARDSRPAAAERAAPQPDERSGPEPASPAPRDGQPAGEASGPKQASVSTTGETRREAPRSPSRRRAAEGAAAGKAAHLAVAAAEDGAQLAPASGALATSAEIDEGEGPVLCPIHNVPLQLLVTREGKALLLHKIDGGDAASTGYCNGQEVRQVARG